MFNTSLILENYSDFIAANQDLFQEATSAASIITDPLVYESYCDKLLEGIEESTARTIRGQFNRTREMLLEESSTLMASPEAITYAVASFPMLVDIYAEPLLSKVCSVYPSAVPTMTIPRLKWIAKVVSIKGIVTEYEFPNAQALIRVGVEKAVIAGNFGNIFNKVGLSDAEKTKFRINRRNLKITNVKLKAADNTEYDINITAYTDARGNFSSQFDVVNKKGTDANLADDIKSSVKIQGMVNFDNGDVTVSIATISGEAFTITETTVECRIQGVGNGLGVVKSRPQNEGIDINCDIEDSFEIENIEEIIQDWKSLYNLDIIGQLKTYVKEQMKLNKDWEIADLLKSNYDAGNGVWRKVNFTTFVGGQKLSPEKVMDAFKSLIPVIIAVIEELRMKTRLDVKYMVAGINTASMIKSLQRFSVSFDKFEGSTGFSGEIGTFSKLEVITSFAVEADMLYFIPKTESLGTSTIVEVSHKPLYIITETTDSIRRTFIKSRNWIGIVRKEAIGSIQITGLETYLGTKPGANQTPSDIVLIP